MKFLEYLLLERNILNTEEMDLFLRSISDRNFGAIQQKIKTWINSNLKNYLLREYDILITLRPDNDSIRSRNLKKEIEKKPWIQKAIDRGEEIYDIILPDSFFDKINHVIDYFLVNPNLNISRISVPEAVRQSIEWTENIGKQTEKEEDPEGAKTVRKYPDGFHWVKITSEQAARREGILMHNSILTSCWPGIESGQKAAYSLRDKDNIPHCTIELTNNVIRQIKGNSNLKVKEKYIKYVKDFINKPIEGKKYDRIEDLDNVDLVKFDGKYLEISKIDRNKIIDKLIEYLFSPEMKRIATGKTTQHSDLAYYMAQFLDIVDPKNEINHYTFSNLFTYMSTIKKDIIENAKKVPITRLLYSYNKLTGILEDNNQ